MMELLDRLMYGAAAVREMQPDTRFLSDMVHTLSHFGYRPATVMRLAGEHLIQFGWESQPGPQFGAFWVSTEDLDFQLELCPGDRPYLSRLQLARRLQVTVAALMEWSHLGLIPGVRAPGVGWQFACSDVERFAAQYVLLEEAASLLGVYSYRLRQWVKKGRLSPVCGPSVDGCQRPLFRRSDVERLQRSRS